MRRCAGGWSCSRSWWSAGCGPTRARGRRGRGCRGSSGSRGSTAREHVRVALRLREFPATRDRFAAGTLSYSKVRSITRCGDPSFEGLLLEWADDATAAQMESVARGFRAAERARRDGVWDEDDGADGEVLGVGPVVRRWDADADLAWAGRGDRRDRGRPAPSGRRAGRRPPQRRPRPRRRRHRGGRHRHRRGRRRRRPRRSSRVDTDGTTDDLPDPATPTRRVSAADRVDALATTLAAAAAAGCPPDTSGLDTHTLVLHATMDDITDGDSARPTSSDRDLPRALPRTAATARRPSLPRKRHRTAR